jgi:hypothetical protein
MRGTTHFELRWIDYFDFPDSTKIRMPISGLEKLMALSRIASTCWINPPQLNPNNGTTESKN